ncbi:MAG: VanW family protein [Bulleidia sp.]
MNTQTKREKAMNRKRLTEICPALLPLRQWQRKIMFYTQMKYDGRTYAQTVLQEELPHTVIQIETRMINPNTGCDMKYQYNKAHNLKLLAKTMDHVVIHPHETFSFWLLGRDAEKHGSYKEGLVLENGVLTGVKGGGLCHMSNALFQAFLHTPLTVIERHPHAIDDIPSPDPGTPYGTDATVSEGWQDLKVTNNTDASYQILISFCDDDMRIRIVSDQPYLKITDIRNGKVTYYSKEGHIYQKAEIYRDETDMLSGTVTTRLLYVNECEIGYPLNPDIKVEER